MSRKLLVLFVLGVAAGCVVAMVKAQESSSRTFPNRTVAANDEGSSTVQSRSVLKSRSVLTTNRSTSSRRSGLADRLKAIQSKPAATEGPSESEPSDSANASSGQSQDASQTRVRSDLPNTSATLPRSHAVNEHVPTTSGLKAVPVTPRPIDVRSADRSNAQPRSQSPWKGVSPNSSRRPSRISSNVIRSEAGDLVLTRNLPVLQVETRGPKAITIHKQAAYQVVVSNRGATDASAVTLTVDIPQFVSIGGSSVTAGVASQIATQGSGQRISWKLDQVASGKQAMLKLLLAPQQNQPFNLAVNWAIAPSSSLAEIAVQEPRLQMTLSGPKDVLYGETKSYVITLTNPGTGNAENVAVNLSEQFGQRQVEVGTVPAGGQKQVTLSYTANEAGQTEMHAEAVADGGLRTEAKETVLVRRAVLQVATAGPKFKYARSTGTYQVRIANTGDAPADRVVASVALPDGAKYTGGIDVQRGLDRNIQWAVGNLAPGAERVFSFHCDLSQSGALRFQTKVAGSGGLEASSSCITTVEALADLKLTVNDPRGPHQVGKDVDYEIRINNRGTKAATNVNLIAQFSEGIEPTSASGSPAEIVPGQAIFKPIARIEPGAEIALKVTARAGKAGNLVYRFELTCNDPETRRVSEGTTRFFGEGNLGVARDENAPGRLGMQPMPAKKIEQR